jgi:hypothetical protein
MATTGKQRVVEYVEAVRARNSIVAAPDADVVGIEAARRSAGVRVRAAERLLTGGQLAEARRQLAQVPLPRAGRRT